MKTTILLLASVLSASAASFTSFDIEHQSGSALIDFQINFDSAPQFFNVDQYGRAADSFQFYLTPNSGSPWAYQGTQIVIRGDEIHVADLVNVRSAGDHSTDPNSGGWGQILGSAAPTMIGGTVEFSVPESVLGLSSTDSEFSFCLSTFCFGAEQGEHIGSFSVPDQGPGMALTAIALLALVAWRRL